MRPVPKSRCVALFVARDFPGVRTGTAPATTEGAADHIAIVVHSLSAGGAQRRLVTLANAFARAGRRVDFVAIRGEGDVDRLLDPAVRCTVLMSGPRPKWRWWLFDGWAELRAWVAENRPRVVLGGITTVHLAAVFACRGFGRERPILALRASRHPRRHFPWSRPTRRLGEPVERALRRWIYDRADLVLAVSRETGEAMKQLMARPERCIDVANPVVTSAFVESLGKPPPHPWLTSDVPVVVAVGRFAWQKRFDLLLEAFAAARRKRKMRLIILGDGARRGELEKQARLLGIGDDVVMPGQVANVGPWLAHADLLVSTSAFEGSPAALIEALAAGVPVVATRCPGGSEELLRDGVGGTLIPMDDAPSAAAAILRTAARPRDRSALKRLVARYGETRSAAEHLALLDRAAANAAFDEAA